MNCIKHKIFFSVRPNCATRYQDIQKIKSTNRKIITITRFTSYNVVEIILGTSNITNNDSSIKGDVTIVSDAKINSVIINCSFDLYTFVTAFYFGVCDNYSVSYSDNYNSDD